MWTSRYLSLESYLLTSKRGWCREFVEMKIRNLQSLLVCTTIHWKYSLTGIHWISCWRSWLASRIQSCVWVLTFPRYMRWCMFWHIRTPRIDSLRIWCWRRRQWIYKNVSWYTMRVPNSWRLIIASWHSQRTALHSARISRRWVKSNVGLSTAYWFSICKISRIIHAINFILQFLNLAFNDSVRSSTNLLLENVDPLNRFNSSISSRLFLWASRRSRFLFG